MWDGIRSQAKRNLRRENPTPTTSGNRALLKA